MFHIQASLTFKMQSGRLHFKAPLASLKASLWLELEVRLTCLTTFFQDFISFSDEPFASVINLKLNSLIFLLLKWSMSKHQKLKTLFPDNYLEKFLKVWASNENDKFEGSNDS